MFHNLDCNAAPSSILIKRAMSDVVVVVVAVVVVVVVVIG